MVHLVYNTDNKVIGWEIRPTTPEEQKSECVVPLRKECKINKEVIPFRL